jgi:hypothetical protein
MYEQGVRARVIERIMGWAPRQMYERHYLRVADQQMHEAIRSLYRDDPALEIAEQDAVHGLATRGLGDEHWQPRFVAAQALGRRGEPEDLAALRVAKNAEVWRRRGAFRKAIRQVRRRSACRP